MQKINYFHCYGDSKVNFEEGTLSSLEPDEILLKNIFCGVCTNDVNQYTGKGFVMPPLRFGHESLSIVVEVGEKANELFGEYFCIGSIVSTYDSDPGFSTYMKAKYWKCFRVPEINPKYILEPVACAINGILGIKELGKIGIFGTGFMALILAEFCKHYNLSYDVIGNNNHATFKKLDLEIPIESSDKEYNSVFILNKNAKYNIAIGGNVVYYQSTKELTINTDEAEFKALTYHFPSPRSKNFFNAMSLSAEWISTGVLNPQWTKGFEFNNSQEAFESFLKRNQNEFKSYIILP